MAAFEEVAGDDGNDDYHRRGASETTTTNTSVFDFRPSSKALVDLVHLPQRNKRDNNKSIVSAVFLPRTDPSSSSSVPVWRRKSRLVYLNKDQEIIQIGAED